MPFDLQTTDFGPFHIAGKVSLMVLMVYVNAMEASCGSVSWFLLVELCRVAATIWLSYWTGISDKPGKLSRRDPSMKRHPCGPTLVDLPIKTHPCRPTHIDPPM